MIALSPADLGRRIVCELDRKLVTVPIAHFDAEFVYIKAADGAERTITWGSFEWEETAKAKTRLREAGFTVEVSEDPEEPAIRIVGGWLYWPRGVHAGAFQRPDGSKGSGYEVGLINAMRGGTVPAVRRTREHAPAAAAAELVVAPPAEEGKPD